MAVPFLHNVNIFSCNGQKILVKIILLGGLHTENVLWICLKNLLASSWFLYAKPGPTVLFLRAIHITRTRHSHQVTTVMLSILQREVSKVANEHASQNSFEDWRQPMIKCSATFWFLNFILKLEVLVWEFVISHWKNNIDLYNEAVHELIFLFFWIRSCKL